MEMLSLIGIVAGVALFVAMAFKGFNLFFSSVIVTLVILLFSRMPLLDSINGSFMGAASGFFKNYLLIFTIGSIFGSIMGESGAAKRIALSLSGLTSKSAKHRVFLTVLIPMLFYFFMTYVGISGLVLVFTIVVIGRELFEAADLPWSLYCYGSSSMFQATLLAGSLSPANIIVAQAMGVPLTAGALMSVVAFVVSTITLLLIVRHAVNKAVKADERFLPTGTAIKDLNVDDSAPDVLPPTILAVIPLAAPIVCIVVFKLHAIIALTIAAVVSFGLLFKFIRNPKKTIAAGTLAAANPTINVAAVSGMVAVIMASSGFGIISTWLDTLPGLLPVVIIPLMMSLVTASQTAGLPASLPLIMEHVAKGAVSTDTISRLVVVANAGYLGPHSAGVVNAVSLTRLDFKKSAWIYFKATFFPGLAATIVCVILIQLGIFT